MSSMLVLLLLSFTLTLTPYSTSAFSPNSNAVHVVGIPSRSGGVEQRTRTSPLFHHSIDRRSTLAASFGILSALVISSPTSNNIVNNIANAQSMPLFLKVKQLETANYMGQIGKPIYPPNVSGDPEEFTPVLTLNGNGNEVTVTAGLSGKHVNDEKNFIQFLWLKDVATEEVVLAKELIATDTNPELKAKVPSGVTLRPYLFSNLHGLWKGEEFTVAGN